MNDPFSFISEFRLAAEVYAGIIPQSFSTPVAAAVDFGLRPNERAFKEIDRDRARAILGYLLRYDLAYGSVLMTEDQSQQTISLVMEMLPDDTKFFTNSDWDRRSSIGEQHVASGTIWEPATDCTFDGGIMALAKNCTVCIWFGDED